MNEIVRHPASRSVAHFLILVLLLPMAALVHTPASAQFGGRVTRQVQLALIDFDVLGEVPPELGDIGATARDAVWNELHQSRSFMVSQRRDVETEIQTLKLEKPFNRDERVDLAESLQVDGICEGSVRILSIEGDPRVARVELQVRILDKLTREYVNGATVTESSDPMPGYSGPDQKLVSDALKKAAASALDVMAQYIVPEGTVMSAFRREAIIINLGERHGLRRDMRFVVLRKVYNRTTGETELERICKLRVKEVRLQDCIAEPDGPYPGVLTEDLVRGVWSGPNLEAAASTRSVVDVGPQSESGGGRKSGSLGKVLLIALVVFLIARLVAGQGVFNSPPASTFAASLSDIALSDAAISVRWSPPSGIRTSPEPRGSYVVAYEVYRGTVANFPLNTSTLQYVIIGGSNTSYTDSADPTVLVAQTITLDVNDTTGIVDVNFTPPGATPSRTVSETGISYTLVPTPLEPGRMYYYAVQVVYKQLNPIPFPPPGETANLAGRLRISLQQQVGPATALTPPQLESPPDFPNPGSTDVDLTTVQFQWLTTAGADTYVIELSTDPSFPRGATVRSTEYRVRGAEGQLIFQRFRGADLSQLFQGLPVQVFWRVGCRNSLDAAEPVDRSGNRVGFVFSRARAFQVQERPPGTP